MLSDRYQRAFIAASSMQVQKEVKGILYGIADRLFGKEKGYLFNKETNYQLRAWPSIGEFNQYRNLAINLESEASDGDLQ
jgi:hypothetical protein